MRKPFQKLLRWAYVVGGGVGVFQVTGCNIDPDIALQTGLSVASDFSIFLLENLVASL